jgi:glutathione reductase (NADPH)
VRRGLADEMRKKGVDLRFGANIAAIEKRGTALCARLEDASELEADQILFAIGRAPNVAGLGLEQIGVALDPAGAVVVDAHLRTSVPNVFAIGDVTNRLNLTPVAIHEGMAVAATLFKGTPTSPDHDDVPTAVFSQPAIGTVGLTETAARARYGAIDVYRSTFRPLKHTLTGREEKTLMKLVVDRASQRVVGAHMLGPDAGEIIQGIAIAVKMRATKAQFDATIGIHPTAAEEFVTMRTPVATS